MSTLPASISRGARLDVVARAVAAASAVTRFVYVERRGSLYRWSPAHRGGPYPLLRETAKILGADYHRLIVPARGLPTTPPAGFDQEGTWHGMCIVAADEPLGDGPDLPWILLGFTEPVTPEVVRSHVLGQLDPPADEPEVNVAIREMGRAHGVIHLLDDEAEIIPVPHVFTRPS